MQASDVTRAVQQVATSLHDPDHWRRRAQEMHAIADGMTILPSAKASLLRTAEEYERLAERAERRALRRNDQADCSAYKNKRLQFRPGASWETCPP